MAWARLSIGSAASQPSGELGAPPPTFHPPESATRQERIIVAPQQELYEMACAYAAQQRDFGNIGSQVVRALDDAYRMLDLKQSDFRPVR